MFYINVLCITLICVMVTDMTDFFQNVKKGICYLLTKGKFKSDNYRIHWLDCSLCQTNILGIITMFLMGCVTLPNYLYVLTLAIFTPVIKDIISTVFNLMETLITKINKLIYGSGE